MGDHLVLLVDRLITESTLETAIESRNQEKIGLVETNIELITQKKPEGKLVECRICQDEDVDSNMESPCSCCGSLKHAHRKCVQRWCNEKGDTMCEICLHQFKPDYTAPPRLFRYGRIPVNFRGSWGISRHDTQNNRSIAVVQNNRDFNESSHYNDYGSSSTRSILYCRVVALIFMVLVILRFVLPIITSGVEQYSLALLVLLLLRTGGIALPLYVMLIFHLRRLQQDFQDFSAPTTEEGNLELQELQPMQTV